MANEQTMISTEMMSLDEQMELGVVTRWNWPLPLEQISQEEMMELGLATMASWQEINTTEMQSFWADALSDAYTKPKPKRWADEVEEDVEMDWLDPPPFHANKSDMTWSQVAWGRCHCGCENNDTRFGAPSSLGM